MGGISFIGIAAFLYRLWKKRTTPKGVQEGLGLDPEMADDDGVDRAMVTKSIHQVENWLPGVEATPVRDLMSHTATIMSSLTISIHLERRWPH